MIPEELTRQLEALAKVGATGQFILDVKDGKIAGWRWAAKPLVDKQPKYALS